MNKWLLSIASLAIGAAFFTLLVKQSLDVSNTTIATSDSLSEQTESTDPNGSLTDNVVGHEQTSTQQSDSEYTDTFITELVLKLQSSYGESIHLLHIQASLIKVKEFVLQRYPADGNEKFVEAIHSAFPEYAESILSILDRLSDYQDWVIENQPELLAMDERTQQGTIWEKRRELFGADAERVWAQELAEMSQQQTAVHQLIETLDQAHELSMDEKLYQLQTAVSELYDGSIQESAVSGGVMAKAFFNFDSVQQELRTMDPDARQQTINDIRRQLGFPDEQIERLQEQDEVRNQRWENGLAYMQERELLVASVSEYERAGALNDLRVKYFKHEAPTIQREEDSNFWRYERRRVYGSN